MASPEQSDLAVRVEHVDKTYRIRQSLNQRRWSRGGGASEDLDDDLDDDLAEDEEEEESQVVTPKRVEALRDISFEVSAGETFGIVGFTGAGKSTLIKLLGRTAPPSAGRITIAKPVAPPSPALARLLDGNSTVRQNMRHMADMLRVDRTTLRNATPEMLAFADLESHEDIVLKRWASGFTPRLAMAMVLHMDARVILSEGPPVTGDPTFRERCMERVDDLVAAGTSVVMTCADPKTARLCSSAIWIDKGQVRMQGTGEEVAEQFERALLSLDPDELDPRVADKVARAQERESEKIARGEERESKKIARAEERKSEKAARAVARAEARVAGKLRRTDPESAPPEPVRIRRAVALMGNGRPAIRLSEGDTLQLELTLDVPGTGRLRGGALLVLDEGRTRRVGRPFEAILESASEVRARIEVPVSRLPAGEVMIDLSATLASGEVASERITIDVVGEQPSLAELRELGAAKWEVRAEPATIAEPQTG